MSIYKREVVLFGGELIDVATVDHRSKEADCEDADEARLLIRVTEIGTPSGDESITIRPIFVDKDGFEYLDANTTYGTFSVTGTTAPLNMTVVIPTPTKVMALKVTGAGSLSSTTAFVVSARLILTANTTR